MPRPIEAVIHLDALRHNLAVVRARAAGRRVWAVVKANAYGHGLERVLPALGAADGLALLDIDEAQRARAAGWRKPILLLEGVFEAADVAVAERLRLTMVVHHLDQVALLERHRAVAALHVYVKFNTGMNRLGFVGQAGREAIVLLAALPQVRIDAVMTHLANADLCSAESAAEQTHAAERAAAGRVEGATEPIAVLDQLARFDDMTAAWSGPRSIANSAALFTQPRVAGDSVRPGIALYGASPVPGVAAATFDLRPAMSLRSRLLSVQSVPAGATVGYGGRWIAQRASRIGVVACGYADGYPRLARDGTIVAVAGAQAPLAGRVSMDMITLDLTDLPQAGPGAPVELWGQAVPIDRVAACAGTVGYELMCALSPRVPVRAVAGAD